MTRFPFDIVGFDLDGTLLDTRRDIAGALNHALAHAGRPPLTVEQVVPMVGGGGRHLIEQALALTGGGAPGEAEALLAVLTDYYVQHPCDHTMPFPGMPDVLDRLRERGVALGIVTNKRQVMADIVLERLGLADRFAAVIGGDAPGIARFKPAPDPVLAMVARLGGGRAAFVGDSRYDIAAGRAAGATTVFCRFGFAPDDAAGADAIIDGFDALVATLERL